MKHIPLISIIALCGCLTCNAQKHTVKASGKKKAVAAIQQIRKDSLRVDSITRLAKTGNANAQNTLGTYYYNAKFVKRNYDTAAKWWALSAKQNNMDAIGNLGLARQKGHGVEKDTVIALTLYKKSIAMGNTELLKQHSELAGKDGPFDYVLLGECTKEGIGTKKDLKKAAGLYAAAAKLGSVDGAREAGILYFSMQDYSEAFPLLQSAVENGENKALYFYAESLYNGYGTTKDLQNAAIYMLKAAEAGNANAAYEVAKMYNKGEGFGKSPESAFKWYKTSASTLPWGQWSTALCYINGIGTEVSLDEGLAWVAKAVQNSKGFLNTFQEKLTSSKENGWEGTAFSSYVKGRQQLNDNNYDEAIKTFKTMAKESVDAKTMLGVCFASKDWKKYDAKKAVKYFNESADAGETKALFLLGCMYMKGEGVAKDATKGLSLITKAADSGYGPAQCWLGDASFEGRGTTHNEVAAADWYQKALANGSLTPQAAGRLATLYERGAAGLKKDKEIATRLTEMSNKPNALKALLSQLK